jgi:hypothetical protein
VDSVEAGWDLKDVNRGDQGSEAEKNGMELHGYSAAGCATAQGGEK